MFHSNKWNITKELLEEQYLNKKKSLLKLSKELKIPYETLFWYKKKFEIPTISSHYWGKGRRNSPLTEFRKRLVPWNKGKKGWINIWNKGKKYSEDHKRKIALATKQAMSRPEIKERIKKTQFAKGIIPWNKDRTNVYAQETIDKIRKARLNQILPKKNTNAEIMLFKILAELGLNFEKQIPIKNICQADAFIKPNIILFADGDYWHCNPKFYQNPITPAQIKNLLRDEKQNRNLIKEGYTILRFWECDLLHSPKTCKEIIRKVIKGIEHERKKE